MTDIITPGPDSAEATPTRGKAHKASTVPLAESQMRANVQIVDTRPTTVTLEIVTSHNQYLVGDEVVLPLGPEAIDLVERGWADVVGVDGNKYPPMG